MKKFWRILLNKSLPPDSLTTMSAAVFGLGDSGAALHPLASCRTRRLQRLPLLIHWLSSPS